MIPFWTEIAELLTAAIVLLAASDLFKKSEVFARSEHMQTRMKETR